MLILLLSVLRLSSSSFYVLIYLNVVKDSPTVSFSFFLFLVFASIYCLKTLMKDKAFNKIKFDIQVLPLACKHFGHQRQRELLYHSLCIMPLKWIERVLPWLVETLTEKEARSFLQNMQMAGSVLTYT